MMKYIILSDSYPIFILQFNLMILFSLLVLIKTITHLQFIKQFKLYYLNTLKTNYYIWKSSSDFTSSVITSFIACTSYETTTLFPLFHLSQLYVHLTVDTIFQSSIFIDAYQHYCFFKSVVPLIIYLLFHHFAPCLSSRPLN